MVHHGKWMAPLDSGSLPDTYSVIQELDTRFGVATKRSLIRTYQQKWITTADLDNIQQSGFNVVRVLKVVGSVLHAQQRLEVCLACGRI